MQYVYEIDIKYIVMIILSHVKMIIWWEQDGWLTSLHLFYFASTLQKGCLKKEEAAQEAQTPKINNISWPSESLNISSFSEIH